MSDVVFSEGVVWNGILGIGGCLFWIMECGVVCGRESGVGLINWCV